jgi:predicted CoA-substrate-specific enzyme activase
VASVIKHTGAEHRRLANLVMREALEKAELGIDDITYIVATGYGRINVPFADKHITELSCHARGVASLFPNVRLAVDIGGQDSKALKIRNGRLLDFVMNDKCAAGTGRFLEVLAKILGLEVAELGPLSLKAEGRADISSPCTVFIQQEVADHLTNGVMLEDIVAGLHATIAAKVAQMARRLKPQPDIVFTGGVAKNAGVVKALEESLKSPVLVPPEPLLSGALGAALLAQEAAEKGEPAKKDRRLDEARLFNGDSE